jgi:hypothetical protein
VIALTGIKLAWTSRLLRRMVLFAWSPALLFAMSLFAFEQAIDEGRLANMRDAARAGRNLDGVGMLGTVLVLLAVIRLLSIFRERDASIKVNDQLRLQAEETADRLRSSEERQRQYAQTVIKLNAGLENRVLGQTRMNATSSRSHTALIVRVEARRLRARLTKYNAGEGRSVPLRIELPVGSYVPQLVVAGSMPPAAEATRRARDLVERGEHYLRQPLSRASLEAAGLAAQQGHVRRVRYRPPLASKLQRGWARAWYGVRAAFGFS